MGIRGTLPGGDGGHWPLTLGGETGGILGKSIFVVLIIFALVGIAIIDGGSMAMDALSLETIASHAADAAANGYAGAHSLDDAIAAAKQSIQGDSSSAKYEPGSMKVDPATGAVTLTVVDTPTTIVLGHLSFLRKLIILHSTATATPGT